MNSESALDHIHPSLRASFVALPSDLTIPLTPEQLEATFPNPNAWKEVIRLTMEQQFSQPVSVKESTM